LPPAPKLLSIHDLTQLESGGTTARSGFAYQDNVAVSFCVEMLADRRIESVWCEVHDDLTLIWNEQGVQEVEFVQVKAERRDALWSTAVQRLSLLGDMPLRWGYERAPRRNRAHVDPRETVSGANAVGKRYAGNPIRRFAPQTRTY
jgi:hypothetical protein